jgi:hypothetical protein
MGAVKTDFEVEGLLKSMLDIRNIVHRTIKDQLTLHPDYKVYVTGYFLYLNMIKT